MLSATKEAACKEIVKTLSSLTGDLKVWSESSSIYPYFVHAINEGSVESAGSPAYSLFADVLTKTSQCFC